MSERKAILYVFHWAEPAGGAFNGTLEMIKSLPGDQYQSYLVCPHFRDSEWLACLHSIFDGIATLPMGGPWTRHRAKPWYQQLRSEISFNVRTWLHGKTQRMLRRLIHQWDIDIVYTGGLNTVDGAIAARLNKVPHVWHIKETFFRDDNVVFYLPHRCIARIIHALSTRIVAMSHYAARPMLDYALTDKLDVIYDGLDFSRYQGALSGHVLRDTLGIPADRILIGLVATASIPQKRHDLFIEMAAILKERYPHACFVHFGPVPPGEAHPRWDYYQGLLKMVHNKALEERFLWAGTVLDIPQMMDAIDILVHPCPIEGFGRIAIEAMAAGTPVVGPRAGGIAESVLDGKTGFLTTPNSAHALAQAAAQLIEKPDLRQRMGQAGRDHVRANFSIEQHIAAMCALFDDALKRSKH